MENKLSIKEEADKYDVDEDVMACFLAETSKTGHRKRWTEDEDED